jgi:hypothetical protein
MDWQDSCHWDDDPCLNKQAGKNQKKRAQWSVQNLLSAQHAVETVFSELGTSRSPRPR